MSRTVTEYRCLLISPGDVSEERSSVLETVATWNAQIGRLLGKRIELVRWETHSTPDGSGEAQKIINKQIVEDCDLAVAVFWSRLGTPTSTHDSGSLEEMDFFLESGRRVLLYFNDNPIPQEALKDGQFEKLQKMRKKYRGLYSTYTTLHDLKSQVMSGLTHFASTAEQGQIGKAENSKGSVEIKLVPGVGITPFPVDGNSRFLTLSVENHSDKIFHLGGLSIPTKDGRFLALLNDHMRRNQPIGGQQIAPGQSLAFGFIPESIVESVSIEELGAPRLWDQVGREYTADESVFKARLSAALKTSRT